MSKIGLTLCLFYLAFAGLCIWASWESAGDPKGSFVLLQLPLALQLGFLDWLGLGSLLSRASWPVAYSVIGSLTLIALYLSGWLVSRAIRTFQGVSSQGAGEKID
ncbi:hypothetical protein [Pseudoxanthomonas sp. UTMC 1351]|uniref:hypothetical protein n=1 Tax=Pseudoxanthomonas sp. UTMC 1351 TaxID=2695853 RepID=UPI0034CF2D50